MGDYEKALPLYQRALEISEKVLGPQHPDVATTLNNLAGLYESMGDYEKALPLYQRALEIREKVLGPQHPYVATTLNNLALLYQSIGDYEKALPLYQRALDIREKVLGPQHPDVATTLNNLAGLYESMGDYEKALPLYQRALEIYEKVLGPQHPSVATTLNNLAGLYATRLEEMKKPYLCLNAPLRYLRVNLGLLIQTSRSPNKIFRFLRLKWGKSEIYFTVCYHWRSYDLVCRYCFSNLRSEKAVRYATGDRDRVLKQ